MQIGKDDFGGRSGEVCKVPMEPEEPIATKVPMEPKEAKVGKLNGKDGKEGKDGKVGKEPKEALPAGLWHDVFSKESSRYLDDWGTEFRARVRELDLQVEVCKYSAFSGYAITWFMQALDVCRSHREGMMMIEGGKAMGSTTIEHTALYLQLCDRLRVDAPSTADGIRRLMKRLHRSLGSVLRGTPGVRQWFELYAEDFCLLR